MTHIIISYRRADSDAMAGRIRDRLANHFGAESIFMDVDSIPFGIDFREHIKQALAQNDILIAIIGPRWLGPGKGGFRIMEETDPVRIEVETALKSGSAVIPVLVGDARMPKPGDLPDGLKDFSFRNAAEVDAGRDFHQHMERLIRSMEMILGAKAPTAVFGATPEVAKPIVVPAAAAIAPAPVKIETPPPAPPTPAPQASAPAPTPAPVQAPQGGRGGAPWVTIALAVLLVAALGGGGWLYMSRPAPEPKTVVAQPKVETPPQPAPQPTGPVPSSSMAAADCKVGGSTAFADNFKTVDPAWVLPSETARFVDGQLAITALENKIARVTYPTLRYKNFAICATFKSPTTLGSPDADTDGGVMFWATDNSNFYLASVYPNGTYSIYRMAADTWAPITAKTKFEGIKTGPGAINEVQVTAKDNVATVFINGAKAQEIRGQPPKENSIVGLYAASAAQERNEWRVINVAVTDLDQPQQPSVTAAPAPQIRPGCKPARTVAFEDHFKSADPGWGVAANTPASFTDGGLVLKPRANKVWEQLYPSLFFKNATICALIKSPTQMKDEQDTANAGIVFWAVNRSNYYTAAVFPNGQFGIYRMVNEQWSKISPAAKSPAVKAGLGATNEVMVSFNGHLGAFHINGQKVFEFRGQPPRNGGTVGVFAGSEEVAENEWRFTDYVVVEND